MSAQMQTDVDDVRLIKDPEFWADDSDDPAGFTAGDWIVSGGTIQTDDPPRFIASVGAPTSRTAEDLANARLIGAAPALYYAAMSALAYMQSHDLGVQGQSVASELLTALTAAAD